MEIGPTIDGRIKIALNGENDYAFFAELLQDAMSEEGVESIVDQIGARGTDDDWEEFVKPDLAEQFQQETLKVGEILAKAQEAQKMDIFIDSENAQNWYSTLNQARLNLENQHNISSMPEVLAEVEPEHLILKMKYENYTYIQSTILDLMEF